MRVVIEAQYACTDKPRGIPTCIISLTGQLLKRERYDYTLTFFDKGKERGNRAYIDRYFGGLKARYCECNSESYATLINGDGIYEEKSYNEITGAEGDLFHFMHLTPIPMRLDGRMIVTIHDILPLTNPEFFNNNAIGFFYRCWKNMLKVRPTVVTDSEESRRQIINMSGYDDVHVIHLGYDENKCYIDRDRSALEKFRVSPPYMFYCGAIDMRKNIIRIIDSFKETAKNFPDMKLVLSGAFDVNSAPIKKKLAEAENDERIILTGFITDDEKRALMSNASVFLFPSFYEGFGLPILEAMACGCPVITSDVSSMPEVAGDAALLIDPNSTSALTEAAARVLGSEKLREELVSKGLERVKAYTWDASAAKLEKLYEQVCGR